MNWAHGLFALTSGLKKPGSVGLLLMRLGNLRVVSDADVGDFRTLL
jgi:hypothetical protein